MSDTTALTDAVSRIERKAEEKENAENVEEKTRSVERSLRRINREMGDLADAVSDLQFYRQLLYEAFDHPDDLPSITAALNQAEDVTEIDRHEVADNLVDRDAEDLQEEISEATNEVEAATEDVKAELRDYWSEWDERLESARDLQTIIGQQDDEFARTVNWLERLVHQDMGNPSKSASNIITEWENATGQWENNQSLQGLSAFQETHDLDDQTISVIRRLSQDSVPLAEVDIDVLEELKGVPNLRDAVQLEI